MNKKDLKIPLMLFMGFVVFGGLYASLNGFNALCKIILIGIVVGLGAGFVIIFIFMLEYLSKMILGIKEK